MSPKVALRFFLWILSLHLLLPESFSTEKFSVPPFALSLMQTKSCLPHQKQTFLPSPVRRISPLHLGNSLLIISESPRYSTWVGQSMMLITPGIGLNSHTGHLLKRWLPDPSGSLPTQTVLSFYDKFHRWQSASNAVVIAHKYSYGDKKKFQILNLQDNWFPGRNLPETWGHEQKWDNSQHEAIP